MKKTMALFLAMLMVLSIIPLAFAENETTNQTVDTGNNETPVEPADTNVTPEPDDTIVIISGNQTTEPDTNVTPDSNETEEPTVELPEEVVEEAGITPDSPLYGLERAMERISLALTLGKSAKAKKGLAHARERLMEVQMMIAAKKIGAAVEAQEAHDEIMEDVEENIEELGDGDAIEELEDEVEIEGELEEHQELVQATNNLRLRVKGLTQEQQTQLNAMLGSLGNSTAKVDIQVKAKKTKTKIKIKAKEGLTDEEVANIVSQVEQAVASGKKSQVVLPGRGKGKTKTVGAEDEGEDEEPEGNETGVTIGKGKPEKGNKGKNKDNDDDDNGDDDDDAGNESDD